VRWEAAVPAIASLVGDLDVGGRGLDHELDATVSGDLARIVALLRTGAADVVQLPLELAEVVRKLRRAARALPRSTPA
jgi:hypothetical protein